MGVLSFSIGPAFGEFTSLNLGLDYQLRGTSIENNDTLSNTNDHLSYYSQKTRFYMRSWLNEDVESSFRLQSVNIWGLEGSSTPVTRYPRGDGTPWVEEAYIHLPHFAQNKMDLIIGRQPIVIGDGLLVSDDQLGFNAIRARSAIPWIPWKIDVDLFTAKVSEGLAGKEDFDLYGLIFGTDKEHRRWEFAWIQERNDGRSVYTLQGSTFTASKVFRQFYDIRLVGNLKDAYYKLEFAIQSGEATLGGQKVKLEGTGQKIELGAQSDTVRFGRFGVRAVFAEGSGDDAGSLNKDESFRPTFGRQWDGLERKGYGKHLAATLSEVYDPSNPFTPGTVGLPVGISGIRTMGLGIFSVQKVRWTGSLDYFIYESKTKPTGFNDIGAELDGEITYRYTGFVTFNFGVAFFFPGQVYGNTNSRVSRYTSQVRVHF